MTSPPPPGPPAPATPAEPSATGGERTIPWDTILQAVGAVTALAAWVALVGGAHIWARLSAAHVPNRQTLAALPQTLFIVEGLQTLLVPLLIGAGVALAIYLSRPLAPPVAEELPAVGPPAP